MMGNRKVGKINGWKALMRQEIAGIYELEGQEVVVECGDAYQDGTFLSK